MNACQLSEQYLECAVIPNLPESNYGIQTVLLLALNLTVPLAKEDPTLYFAVVQYLSGSEDVDVQKDQGLTIMWQQVSIQLLAHFKKYPSHSPGFDPRNYLYPSASNHRICLLFKIPSTLMILRMDNDVILSNQTPSRADNTVGDSKKTEDIASTTATNITFPDDNVPLSVKMAQMRAARDAKVNALKEAKLKALQEQQQPKSSASPPSAELPFQGPLTASTTPTVKQSVKKPRVLLEPVVKTERNTALVRHDLPVEQKITTLEERVIVKKEIEKKELLVVKKTKKRSPEEEIPVKKSKTNGVKKRPKIEGSPAPESERSGEDLNGELSEESGELDSQTALIIKGDGTVKWQTLEHKGPLFPPLYEPHGIPLIYEGKECFLEPDAEEVASFFGALIETDHGKNPTFQRNFFADFKQVLNECNSKYQTVIRDFEKCNFSKIFAHFQRLKEERKQMTKEQKAELKEIKKKLEDEYGYAILDGERERVGNFRIEPPGLFRGRGKHPKTGKLKQRVKPEQVTINIGMDAPIPSAPSGHSWGSVIHDNTVTWLATWTENVNSNTKYVFLAPGSSLKAQSDLKKFETARQLKNVIDGIRVNYMKELHDKEMTIRQRATALWLIDKLALRAGNEKGEDEADTVGCCSLRCEHVTLQEPNTVIFDFLGKDSIRYFNSVPVDTQVFKNLGIFMRPPKTPSDLIFDRLTTSSLNKYLNQLMTGLTAKVFRTYNASHTFQQELQVTPFEGTIPEKILAYNRANRQVAILCNHQRSIPKTHDQSMERLKDKLLTLKYQRHLVRKELRDNEGKKELKKLCPLALEDESDLDSETIKRKKKELSSPEKDSKKKTSSTDTLIKRFDSLTTRIQAAKHQIVDKDENKTTALGTSKTNYIDPRITAAWCRGHQVPVEKMFNKSLREKFKWAMDVSADWEF